MKNNIFGFFKKLAHLRVPRSYTKCDVFLQIDEQHIDELVVDIAGLGNVGFVP